MSSIETLNFLEFPLDIQQEILLKLSRNNFLKFFDVLLGDRRFGSLFINSKNTSDFKRKKIYSDLYRKFLNEFRGICRILSDEFSGKPRGWYVGRNYWWKFDPRLEEREIFKLIKKNQDYLLIQRVRHIYFRLKNKDPDDHYKEIYRIQCGKSKYENEILTSYFEYLGLKIFHSSDIGDNLAFNLFLPSKGENNLKDCFYEIISGILKYCVSKCGRRFDIYSYDKSKPQENKIILRRYDPLISMYKNFEYIISKIYYLETVKNIIYVFNQFDRCFPVFDQKRKRLHYFKCCPYEYPEVQKLFHLILNNPKMPENVKIEVQSVVDTFKIKLPPISDEKILTYESQNFSNSALSNSNVSQIPSFVDEYSVFLKSESNLNSLQEEIQLNYVKLLDSSNVETISKCPSEYQFEELDQLDLISSLQEDEDSEEDEGSEEEYEEEEEEYEEEEE